METIFCNGCGIQIQTTDPEKLGYAPSSSLNRDTILCQRCFRLKHYNEIQDISMSDEDFMQLVSSISEQEGLVVYIIDIFDVSGSFIPGINRIVGNHPIILVGNKVDLLPKSVNKQKLIQWLRSQAKEAGIKTEDVFLISSKKGFGMDELAASMEAHRKNKNIYIVGTTNVGKSTFINRLIQRSTGDKDVITTSYFPGTTLGFIKIPLDDASAIIDTPGIINKQQIVHYLSEEDLKIITPKKEIKPKVYQLNSQQTLFFGGLARIDFLKGERQSFVCYFSNDLNIHRTKLEKADELYENHVTKLLSPPNELTLKRLPPLEERTFRIGEEKTDIVFPGLGWVSLSGSALTVRVFSPKGVPAISRKSII